MEQQRFNERSKSPKYPFNNKNLAATELLLGRQTIFQDGAQIMIMENDVVLLRLSQAQLTQVDKHSFRARLGLKSFLLYP